jgi:hypothetical protein
MSPGILHVPGTSTVTFAEAGTYKVTYSMSGSLLSSTTSLAIYLNGVAVPGTQYSSTTSGVGVTGEAMITVAAGDVLTVVNTSPLITNVSSTPPNVNSSLLIEKMGN